MDKKQDTQTDRELCVGGEEINNQSSLNDAKEKTTIETLIGPIEQAKPNVTWSDVIGLEEAKQELKELVLLPQQFPELFNGRGSCVPKTILLYGPPGSGKSYLAKALATESGLTYIPVYCADLVYARHGEKYSEMLKDVFSFARRRQPSIILLEEVDLFGHSLETTDTIRRIRTEFLIQMEELRKLSVYVLGTTCKPWSVDPATRKRFVKRINMKLPDTAARRRLFAQQLNDTRHEFTEEDFDLLAEKSSGYSCADISCIVRDGLMEPVRRLQKATHFMKVSGPCPSDSTKWCDDLWTPCSPDVPDAVKMSVFEIQEDKISIPVITKEDVIGALEKMGQPTVSQSELVKHEEFTKNFVTP